MLNAADTVRSRRLGRPAAGAEPRLEQVVVIALAAGRLARAISVDSISEPARTAVDRWSRRDGSLLPTKGRELVRDVVHCSVCAGFWTSVAMSLVWPGGMRVRRGLAVAGTQVLLTLGERLVSEQGRLAIHVADEAEERVEEPSA